MITKPRSDVAHLKPTGNSFKMREPGIGDDASSIRRNLPSSTGTVDSFSRYPNMGSTLPGGGASSISTLYGQSWTRMLHLKPVAPVQHGGNGPRKAANPVFGDTDILFEADEDQEALKGSVGRIGQPSLPTETKWKAALSQLSLRQAKSAPSFHAPATAHPYGRDSANFSDSRQSKMASTTHSLRREKASQSQLRQAKSAPSVQASATTRSFGRPDQDFPQSRHSMMASLAETSAAPQHLWTGTSQNQVGKPCSQRILNPKTVSLQDRSLGSQRTRHPRVESLRGRQVVNPGPGRDLYTKNDSCLDREVVHQNTGRASFSMGESFLDQKKTNPCTAKVPIQGNFQDRNPREERVLHPKSASFQVREMPNTKIGQAATDHTESVLRSSTLASHPKKKKSVSFKEPAPGGSKNQTTRQLLVMWSQTKRGLSSDSMTCSSQDVKSESLRVAPKEAASKLPVTRQSKKRPSSMRFTDWLEESGDKKKAKMSPMTMTNKVSDREFQFTNVNHSSSATMRPKDHDFVQPGAYPSAMDFCRGEIPVTSTPKVKLGNRGKMMSISQFIKINDSIEIQEIQELDDSGKQPADKASNISNIGTLDNTIAETTECTDLKNVGEIRRYSLMPSTKRSSGHTRNAMSEERMVPSEEEVKKDAGDSQIPGIKRIMHLAEPSPRKLRKADTSSVGAHLDRAKKAAPSFKEIPNKRRMIHNEQPYSPEKLRKTDRDVNPLHASRATPSMQLIREVKTAPYLKEIPNKRRLAHQEEPYSPEKMRKTDRYVHKPSIPRKMADGAFDETQGFRKLMHLAEPVFTKVKDTDSEQMSKNRNSLVNRCLGNFPTKFLKQTKSSSTLEMQPGTCTDAVPALVWAAKCIKKNAGHTPRPLKRSGRNKYQERLID